MKLYNVTPKNIHIPLKDKLPNTCLYDLTTISFFVKFF